MSEPTAKVVSARRLSPVWILPLLALAVSLWLTFRAYLAQGPEVELRFETAEGIVADKTPVKARSVDIGVVRSARLSEDNQSVVVVAEIDKKAQGLLREDTQFWVVRPRVGPSGISGMGTLFSGVYLEMAPGDGPPARDYVYEGLSQPPVTPSGTPGLRLGLYSESAKSLSVGDPVLYRGLTVGRVENFRFEPDSRYFWYDLFIEEPYRELVTRNTRFWNASGFAMDADTQGLDVRLDSLEALISGGVAFDLPELASMGEPIESDATFRLYRNRDSASGSPYAQASRYLLLFESSVRGLKVGAPVTFRGVTVGSVAGISFNYLSNELDLLEEPPKAAVLIRVEPARFGWSDTPAAKKQLEEEFKRFVANGLRASLAASNLLTGALYVSLDFHSGAEKAAVASMGGFELLPTRKSGIELVEERAAGLLGDLRELPLASLVAQAESTLGRAETTLEQIEATAKPLAQWLDSEAGGALPRRVDAALASLRRLFEGYGPDAPMYHDVGGALDELNDTLVALQRLARTLENQPNALFFRGPARSDPEPRAKKP